MMDHTALPSYLKVIFSYLPLFAICRSEYFLKLFIVEKTEII